MLRELFALWRDRGTRLARRFGLDQEAVRIAARHRRCRTAWASHLAAVRALVLASAATAPGRDTAVILGSGLCLDVPLAELSACFRSVVLVDIHHPRPARRLARAFPNIRLVAADVTGMAQAAERLARAKKPLPLPVPPPDPLPGVRPDFTASLNLASQLPIPFYRTLGGRVDEAELAAFGRGLIEAHLAWLAGLPGRTCLVCDTLWQRLDSRGVLESEDALEDVGLPEPDRVWTWSIAPRPEESLSYDRQNQVWGYADFSASWNGPDATVRRGPGRPGSCPSAIAADGNIP
jgi:hypothetical protein